MEAKNFKASNIYQNPGIKNNPGVITKPSIAGIAPPAKDKGHGGAEGHSHERPPNSTIHANGERVYPVIPKADSLAIKKNFKYLKSTDDDKKIAVSEDTWKNKKKFLSSFNVTPKQVEEKTTAVVKDLNWINNQYGMKALKGVRDHYGYGPKNKKTN
jgi:hypothetical protein